MSDQSTGRDIDASWIKTVSTPPQYLPRVEDKKMLIKNTNNEFLIATLLPVVFAFFAGALIMLLLLLGFSPLGN